MTQKNKAISIRATAEFELFAEKARRVLGFNSIPEFLKGAAIAFAASQGIKPDIEDRS